MCWYLPIDLMPVIFLKGHNAEFSIPQIPDRIVWASIRFCKIWWVCLVVFLNWLNWMLCDSSLHSRNLIPAVLSIPVGFLIKCPCYFFTCNWVDVSYKQKPFNASYSHVKPHVCSFLGLKVKDQPETLDIGKINIPNYKGHSSEHWVKGWSHISERQSEFFMSCMVLLSC